MDEEQICKVCGKVNSAHAVVCSDCGNSLTHTTSGSFDDETEQFEIDGVSGDILSAMVKNEYYVKRFRKFARHNNKISFNFGALLISPWLFARKMYKQAFLLGILFNVVFCIGIIFTILIAQNTKVSENILFLMFLPPILFMLIFAIFANYLYMKFVTRKAKGIIVNNEKKQDQLYAAREWLGSRIVNIIFGYFLFNVIQYGLAIIAFVIALPFIMN
ncbi:MAG: DUF2628 domain-containing protein [Clostridiales bacterium]|nr:DUF2628 domain-containing protein [Clostridiales bacterium]